jgi:hypothetical protein
MAICLRHLGGEEDSAVSAPVAGVEIDDRKAGLTLMVCGSGVKAPQLQRNVDSRFRKNDRERNAVGFPLAIPTARPRAIPKSVKSPHHSPQRDA